MGIYDDAQNGSLTREKLESYLRAGLPIDAEDSATGLTPLAAAAKGGHANVVKLLLQHNADANNKTRDGKTPLYLAANAERNRPLVVHLLLEYNAGVDDTSDMCENETPLMVAITKAQDPEVIQLLVDAGASLTRANDRGETAQVLAEQSSSHAIRKAILPKDERMKSRFSLTVLVVKFLLFILSYVNLGYIIGIVEGVVTKVYGWFRSGQSNEPDSNIAEEIENPRTVADFTRNVHNYVAKNGLDDFFPPGDPFIEKVAAKAVEVKNDPSNKLNTPDQIRDLTTLALYQPVLYCVKRMTNIATRAVPDNKGVHLRFINLSDTECDDLDADAIERRLEFVPVGGTAIGRNLREKILKPFIYDVLDRGDRLERPYVILTITDGCPTGEKQDEFRNAIVECGKRLKDKGYKSEAVMFLISQVGTSEEAEEFLDSLEEDMAVKDVLHRTSGHLDGKYEELRKNEQYLEGWLLNVLMSPILHRATS